MSKDPSLENVKCPECDGPMLSRTGKYGVFWGCKNFPECRGTRDSMGRSKEDRDRWKAEQKGEEYEPEDKDKSEIGECSFKKSS